jgi:hypothetical protein
MPLTNAERQRLYIQRLKARAAQAAPIQEPCEAQEPRALTSAEQDQILHLALQLLMTVDHPHRKKFYKHFVSNSHRGIFLPSCSHRGWKGAGYAIDASLLDRLWRAFKKN